eukprot:c23465_g1_i1.p1 GENE.c23465_g1_i1~~c23465_g1_i1.p1  ORF type:complete len:178 (-),score=49.92 c23465_g1_i1:52-585(-)
MSLFGGSEKHWDVASVLVCGEQSDVSICAKELLEIDPTFRILTCDKLPLPPETPVPRIDFIVVLINIHSGSAYTNARDTLKHIGGHHVTARIVVVALSGNDSRGICCALTKVQLLCETYFDVPCMHVQSVKFETTQRLGLCADRLVSLVNTASGTALFDSLVTRSLDLDVVTKTRKQ